ncbi:DGQHR domain-containing protein DpdB [Umezawaea sp. Da 62-37]|uniref:DGQHR domain-containing protein DpdB n=1 Tax=Umezawaea sp. Da 62-37 TaxID=3075927 RepID=UPI0028F748AB|nr:DGQHR domain-containing protein DpdB [Umezawaea sp. Da 62-37]WNV92019.1 DGQHR domain-containing protein DpdB [Umezawaea sp. Da 62-37]
MKQTQAQAAPGSADGAVRPVDSNANPNELRVPAIEIQQGKRRIYTFAVDGTQVHEFAAVSRIRRDHEQLHGYQRPEALAHVRAIRRYLESADAILPNALVLAFDPTVRFIPREPTAPGAFATLGELVIPIDLSLPPHQRSAWMVDGQQRAAALRDADLDSFPVAAVGFISDAVAEQRTQFILVNSTKPLPKGLIHELLPDTTGPLPPTLARRRLPAEVMVRLNTTGPFAGRIKSPTAPDGYIQDTSVMKMIEHSLHDGALYHYRDTDGTGDIKRIIVHLNAFWSAVRDTWPEDWELPPRRSRLTHGVGIAALGYVMDALTDGITATELSPHLLRERLECLLPHTAWSSGHWNLRDEQCSWNGLQNTTNDISRLARHLQRTLPTTR